MWWSWISPLIGFAIAIPTGAMWAFRPEWDNLELLSMLAGYGGLLAGRTFTIAGGGSFLFKRRGGIHVVAGIVLNVIAPLILITGLIAYDRWLRQ